jgi:hypothetical protein
LRLDVNLAVFFPLAKGDLFDFLMDLGSLIPLDEAEGVMAVGVKGDFGSSDSSDGLVDEDNNEEEEVEDDDVNLEKVIVVLLTMADGLISVLSNRDDLNILIMI